MQKLVPFDATFKKKIIENIPFPVPGCDHGVREA